MPIIAETKKLFSDLRVKVFSITVITILVSIVVLYELFLTKAISYQDFDFLTTAIGLLVAFIASIFVAFRKDKKILSSE